MPERSCIACRKKGEKGELIKLINGPQGIVIDYLEKLPGRGAYVCGEPACIDKALGSGQLSKALREKVEAPAWEAFHAELRAKVERKINALLGMARKAGLVAAGFDAAVIESRKEGGGVMVVAADLAGNTEDKLKITEAAGVARFGFSTKDELGSVLGLRPVGVIYIRKSTLADSIKKEFLRFQKLFGG
jgi:uncharacterized protein